MRRRAMPVLIAAGIIGARVGAMSPAFAAPGDATLMSPHSPVGWAR
jgi:hypothetical protein